MKCPNCQSEVPEAANFCAHCGKHITAKSSISWWQRPNSLLIIGSGLVVAIIIIAILFSDTDSSSNTAQDESSDTGIGLEEVSPQQTPHSLTEDQSTTSPTFEPTRIFEDQQEITPTPEPTVEELKKEGLSLVWYQAAESLAIADDLVFIQKGNSIQANMLATGDVLWQMQMDGPILGADSDNVYVLPFLQRIDALDVTSSDLRWSVFLDSEIKRDLGIANFKISRDFIFVPFRNGLVTFSKDNGEFVYTWPSETELRNNGEYLYYDDKTIAFHEDRGQLWDVSEMATELFLCDDVAIYQNREIGSAEAISASTGSFLWKTEFNTQPIACPVHDKSTYYNSADYWIAFLTLLTSNLFHYDEVNIYTYHDSLISALDKETGAIIWQENADIFRQSFSAPANRPDMRFLGEAGESVIFSHPGFGITEAHDVHTNEVLWQNSSLVLRRIVWLIDDTLIGELSANSQQPFSEPHILVGVDIKTGMEKWRFTLQATSPFFMEYQGQLIYPNDKGTIHSFHPEFGIIEPPLILSDVKIVLEPLSYGDFLVLWSPNYVAVLQ